MQCRICESVGDFERVWCRETLLKTGDEFYYFQCTHCNCLQIEEIPENPGDYYPPTYYSFTQERDGKTFDKVSPIKRFLSRQLLRDRSSAFRLPFIKRIFPGFFRPFQTFNQRPDSKILDVGCGAGMLLKRLRSWGFSDLQGVDPYLKESIHLPGLTLHKKELSEMEGVFDWIMLHHSIEHVPDPIKTLKIAGSLLSHQGVLHVSTPLAGCYGWRNFGIDWYGMDPPRHLHIFTVQGMEVAAKHAGLTVCEITYSDSDDGLIASYETSLLPREKGSPAKKKSTQIRPKFKRLARQLQKIGDADVATYYLRRT